MPALIGILGIALGICLVLIILIGFHEFGHFIFAKLFGVKVLRFSIGFGPVLFPRKSKPGKTEFVFSAIPLGGYVKMLGEGGTEKVLPEERPQAFDYKPIWQRVLIIVAGPLFSIMLAFILNSLNFLVFSPSNLPVHPSLSYYQIIKINGWPVATWDDYLRQRAQLSSARTIYVTLENSQKEIAVVVIKSDHGQLAKDRPGPLQELQEALAKTSYKSQLGMGMWIKLTNGVNKTINDLTLTVNVLVEIAKGNISPKDSLAGPVKMTQIGVVVYRASGWRGLLNLMAIISLSLGLFNLLPFPVLDGGHLPFLLVEAVCRKPVPLAWRQKIQMVGLMILIAVALLVLANDLGWFS